MTCWIVEGVETLVVRQRNVPRYSFCTPRPMTLYRKYQYSTDKQFVADLIAGNERATEFLLYGRFRSLLVYNAQKAAKTYLTPGTSFDPADFIHELYIYLQNDHWAKLRKYDPSLPFEKWLSVVSYRFFKDHTLSMLDAQRQTSVSWLADSEVERIYSQGETHLSSLMMDLRDALNRLDSERDRNILRSLLVNDEEPTAVAARFGITIDNLYNIKRRALAKLIRELEIKQK